MRPEDLGKRIERAYAPSFLCRMTVAPADVERAAVVAQAFRALGGPARQLADTLLVGVGPGNPVPGRLRAAIEADGDDLWRAAILLPRMWPGPGATIDPRHYAAACRVNSALEGLRVLEGLGSDRVFEPSSPPADARWDAVIVGAALEGSPPSMTKDGVLRRDHQRRLVASFGPDEARWTLALATCRALSLARPAAGALHGFPESSPRVLQDPAGLLEGPMVAAAAVLQRVVGGGWVELDVLSRQLEEHCPQVLSSDRDRAWEDQEGAWLRAAADGLHRVGALDAVRDHQGVIAVRRAGRPVPRPPGILITPDMDILVAPWELPSHEYGRLCRIAPYVDGDVVYRHRLTRAGVAADLAAGHDDALDWLAVRSRIGVPRAVRESIDEWTASAARVTLLTGVAVLERDGAFEVVEGGIPASAREFWYGEQLPAWFRMEGGVMLVPFGQDPLTVRAAVARLGDALAPKDGAWRWRLAPRSVSEPDKLLDRLRRFHNGELPGELEAAVHAAAGRCGWWVEEAVVLHLPLEAAGALRRDRLIGPLLGRDLGPGQCIIDRRHLGAVRDRLVELGFQAGPAPD